jgi:hypothetical protein
MGLNRSFNWNGINERMSLMGKWPFMKSYNGWSIEKRVNIYIYMPERPILLFMLIEFSFSIEGSSVPFI